MSLDKWRFISIFHFFHNLMLPSESYHFLYWINSEINKNFYESDNSGINIKITAIEMIVNLLDIKYNWNINSIILPEERSIEFLLDFY